VKKLSTGRLAVRFIPDSSSPIIVLGRRSKYVDKPRKAAIVNAQEVAAILSAVAWPIAVMGTVLLMLTPLRSLLNQLSRSLKLRAFKLKLWGLEAELTVEQAQSVLDRMSQMVVDAINELCPEERDLFEEIATSDENRTVKDLLPDFKRGDENKEHQKLRKLRDIMLIRPKGGGRWRDDKYPIVTRFGRLAQELHLLVQIQSQQKSPSVFEKNDKDRSS